MQRIALGAVTGLTTQQEPTPTVRIGYRLAGLRHIIMTALGAAPSGTLAIDTARVEIREVSRNRTSVHTIPTSAVEGVTTELTRQVSLLIVGVFFVLIGSVVLAFGIADRRSAGWWPALEREVTADALFTVGGVLLGLALVWLVAYVFRRQMSVSFHCGSAAGGRVDLRRSWKFPLRLADTLHTLGVVADVVVESRSQAGNPTPTAP